MLCHTPSKNPYGLSWSTADDGDRSFGKRILEPVAQSIAPGDFGVRHMFFAPSERSLAYARISTQRTAVDYAGVAE
jgi:hypothetical protein